MPAYRDGATVLMCDEHGACPDNKLPQAGRGTRGGPHEKACGTGLRRNRGLTMFTCCLDYGELIASVEDL